MNEGVNYVKIQWIEFENLKTGLKIEKIYFNNDITLLVGLSGAGKTQILNVAGYSLNLAVHKNVILRPYRAGIGILIDEEEYEWFYEINKINENELVINGESKYGFSFEKLTKNKEVVFERRNTEVTVMGYDKVPQPKKDESLILQYSEDKNFDKLVSGINKLYVVETEPAVRDGITSKSFSWLKSKAIDIINSEKQVKFKIFSHFPVAIKLYIAKNYYSEIYNKIFNAVKELFIEIEDINVEEDSAREVYLVSIQVYGKKLLQDDISSGMLKTIYYITELFTMPRNSLVLIDEFENGLGVNCIDLLSELILSERNDLQFIITSHHPKIVNAIDKDKWKIIDRDGCIVKNSSSITYGIGNSQHDAYFNLINRWEFEGKIL